MTMRRTARAGIVAAIVALPLVFASTASAVEVHEGSDYAAYTGGTLFACDLEADGNGVYAEYRGPGASHGYIWDGNGSQGGCSTAQVAVTSFRVCEDTWGPDTCSSWVTV
ncbi:hypothetical protein ACIA8O_19135 [Kitasatospora sp. NPDC051853]|uniref:hypothetical protein n=1 Tax=Kitasatospora sp. NPDC051853 TaxID=3364058 RepID=UPI0037A11A1B